MIIQCQGCAARYFLPEDRVPAEAIRVRCPKCKSVFTLAPRHAGVASAVAGPAPAPIAEPPVADSPGPSPVSGAPAETTAPGAKGASTTRARRGRSKGDRARRLARVLVSDILCYNREKRDQALQDGTLMTALGEEIKKSWELYKEKVGEDVAGSTQHFKEALNEILADGQEVF